MRKRVGKALYVFLCSLMGMVLFAMLHRALAVIYYILLNSDFDQFSLGLTEGSLQALDFLTLLMALFLGGWYGTALGIHWYRLVYEGPFAPGLFHAVIPHHWRKARSVSRELHPQHSTASPHLNGVRRPLTKEQPAKIVHMPAHSRRMDSIDVFETFKSMPKQPAQSWDLEDLEKQEVATKPARKPKAPAKPKAKRVVKHKTKTTEVVTMDPEPEPEPSASKPRKSSSKVTTRRTRSAKVKVTEV